MRYFEFFDLITGGRVWPTARQQLRKYHRQQFDAFHKGALQQPSPIPNDTRPRETCPECLELMLVGASTCPHCHTNGITWYQACEICGGEVITLKSGTVVCTQRRFHT